MQRDTRPTILVGPMPLTIEQVLAVARGEARVALSTDPEWRARIAAGVEAVASLVRQEKTIYGVTTGVGDSCETSVPSDHAAEMQLNLLRFHGCGTGRILSEQESAAVVVVRLASLALGWSGIRAAVLERLCELLNRRVLPCIPAEGSVGASGDLTPLSYVAAALVGEREVYQGGRVVSAAEGLAAVDLAPLTLGPKEALAIMNGTSVMTGLACIAFDQSVKLARFAASLTAMASDVTRGNQAHFDDRIFRAKPHPGQRTVARWIRDDIGYDPAAPREVRRVQDRYSIRCTPHIVGVLVDAQPFMRTWLETEINGANDNPLIDVDTGDVLHGGNFYGGHVAFVMDGLKTAVANIADLLDRQMALICNPATNNGLSANLVATKGPGSETHHGFKAMQISTSALAAEALKLSMPASVFSRSTECHNQDKVSMGTIAARDCLRIVELTEQIAAIHLLALCQAVDLREQEGCNSRSKALHAAVRREIPAVTADRRMDVDIRWALSAYRAGALPCGEA